METWLLHRHASTGALLLLCGLPLLLAGLALLSRDIVLSDQFASDVLLNLSGAWHLNSGHRQHVDFHAAVGSLNFLMSLAGFQIVGFKASAFLVGQMLMALLLSAMAVMVVGRRLPLGPSVVFVLYVTLLAMMPTNVGNYPDSFTFAAAYNRHGWSAISILCLILFAPPRPSKAGDMVDIACGLLLLLAMFYLDIAYCLAGICALVLALWISGHARARWWAWAAVGLLVLANAATAYGHAYLTDIQGAFVSQPDRMGVKRLLVAGVLGNATELSIHGAGLITAIWLWRQGRVTMALPLTTLFLIVAAILLFAQTMQLRGLPLGAVIPFLLYGALLPFRGPSGWVVPVLLLAMPAVTALTAMYTIADYVITTPRSERLLISRVNDTRDLAMPLPSDMPASPLERATYFSSLLEAASLFSPARYPSGRIVVIDRINPLPFILGFPPPRGGDLFWDRGSPPRPAEEILGDADYVLVPTKSFSSPRLTRVASERFTPYLTAHFPIREEADSWILYARVAPRG
ncbi:hypothetical protein [Niveispirillum sp. KHB5.9]|uniref:hypothetical protein n=1 Tax=Niveispirillum sp. KHB5.9 TaxID=3400269 RepID=UPI003A8C06DA